MVETPAPARILLVALALAMVVGVSGCFGGGSDKEEEPTYGPDGSPLPPLEVDVEEPEPDVVKAFEDYQRAIFSRDGEGVRVMQSSMVSARPIRSESQAYAEWGSNDVLRVDISSDSVGPLSGILFCASDRVVLIRPEASVEARPPGDPDHNCAVLLFPVEPQALFGVDDLARMERDPPVIREDGNVDLAYRDATQSVNVTLDRQGRLLWTEFRNADTVFQVALDYGERQPLYVPDGDARLPARVKYDERYDVLSGQVVWAVQESLQVPPLSEIEVRIIPVEEPTQPEVVFRPDGTSDENQAGFSFLYSDVDEDGRLSAGDLFTLQTGYTEATHPQSFFDDYRIEVFDTWAGAPVGDRPVPGPSWVVVAGAALAGAALLRRRVGGP